MRLAVLLTVTGLAFVAPAPALGAELQANPSNLASVFGAAQAGDMINLAAGDYGTFRGGAKPGMVTLRAPSGTASMSAQFSPASFITLDGLTVGQLGISGGSHHISVVNSRFTGQADLDMTGNANANIVIDHSTFDNISVCGSCPEGRLEVRQYPRGSQPVGVTVSNNHFGGPGESDGVQVGANGVVITGNVFDGLQQGSYGRHVDSIQLYGQSNTTITNNHFKNFSVAIMAPDGGDHEIVSNNVIDSPNPGASAVQFGHHDGTVFTHNTVRNTDVHAWVGSGDSDPNRDMVLRDNVMVNAGLVTNGCSGCTVSHNLFSARGKASGANTMVANPVFAGGANLGSYAGWALAAGSPGKGAASDGTDRGINLGAVPAGGPAVPPPALVPPSPAPGANQDRNTKRAGLRFSFRPRTPVAGRRVTLTAPGKRRGAKCVWTIGRAIHKRGCRVYVRFGKAGLKHISLKMTAPDDVVTRSTRDVRVVRPKARHR